MHLSIVNITTFLSFFYKKNLWEFSCAEQGWLRQETALLISHAISQRERVCRLRRFISGEAILASPAGNMRWHTLATD